MRATSADLSFTDQIFAIAVIDDDEFDVGIVTDTDGSTNAVNENAAVGTIAGITATATDADATNNSITYSLFDNDGGRFTINSSTGVVTVAGAINRETDGPSRNITVRATSADSSFSDQIFAIAINDVDEFDVAAVTDTDAAANAVTENATVGTLVGITAAASDADATNNAINYSLLDNDGGRFTIDSTTGVITVAGAINRESDGPSRSVTVRATSADLSFTDQVFAIAINDVDEFNVGLVSDLDATTNGVIENANAGTLVGITATASDADATTSTVTYSLLDNDGGRFTINSGTGVVTVAGPINREVDGPTRNITVRATSADLSFSDQIFSITISDVDEFNTGTISDTDAAANAVDENAVIGTTVGLTALASDADATNNAITYSLSNNAGGRFAIDSSTGVVTVAGTLDRETDATHIIAVRADSADGSQSTRAFSIVVNDVAEPDALWFTTWDDVTASGNPDLANWDEDQVLQFGDPGLNFDPNGGSTAGVLGITGFKASNFGAPATARIEAIHHVWSNVTVGSPGNDFDLQEGDLLLSLAHDGMTLSSNTEPDKTFDKNDVFVFRPIASGDYTDGDFFHLLDDPLSSGRIRGVSLVESPAGVLVGDTVLPQGTFLLVREGTEEDDRVYTYTPTSVGLLNTSGPPADILLEGWDLTETANGGNLGFNALIDGIHLVETTATIGGTTIQAGDLLLSTYAVSSIAGTSVTDQDIALLRMSTTRIGNDHSTGSAILFFDGSDEAMMPLDANEDINALTLVEGAISNAPIGGISDTDPAANQVDEDAVIGATVGISAVAIDPDPTDSVTYTLDDDAAGRFTIDSVSGVVTVNGALDAEAFLSHSITVRATSDDTSVSTRDFTIVINDVDEFDVGSISDTDGAVNSVNENAATGTFVGITASATDADVTNNSISYSLSDDDGGRFTIDSVSGAVTVAGPIDREADGPTRNITVRAMSSDGSLRDQVMAIAISDIDEFDVGNVSDTNTDLNEVDENASVGTVVGITAAASDADASNNTISYTLFDTDGGRFAIDSVSGVVTVAGAIDREADGPTRNITVRATSSDGSVTDQVFAITIKDVDEFDVGMITDADTASNAVNENAAIGTIVGIDAAASDNDATNNTISYALQNSDGGRFAIDATTGVVTVAGAIDREADGPTRNITIRATSSDGSLRDQAFTIAVNDVDEFDLSVITDTNGLTNQVDENAAIGTIVGITATATDDDTTNNTVNYSLLDDDGGRFTIEALSGVVTVAGAINRETDGPIRNITVRATSTDGSVTDQVFAIAINDLDEFDVGAVADGDGATNAVDENAVLGTIVGITASAIDDDATNNTISYALLDDDGGRFAIDVATGVITVAGAIDREADGPTRNITVRATSTDGSVADQAFAVTINDVNEFNIGPVTDTDNTANGVDENVAVGTIVGITATATDDDAANNTVSYSLADNDGGRFSIDATSGVVTVAGAIDRETLGPSRNIIVRATSTDGSISDQLFTIAINDVDEFDVGAVNDADPTANEVDENAGVGTLVGITAAASDDDATNNTVSYSLLDNDGGRFSIDTASGEIMVAAAIDRETDGPLRNITVRAASADGSVQDRLFTIAVNDVDEFDIGAVADTDGAANQVDENAAIGTIVGITAAASDDDAANNMISYALIDDDSGRFAIDSVSGVVTVAGAINREADGTSRNITVRASSSDGSVSDQVFAIVINDVDEFDLVTITDADTSANQVVEGSATGTLVGVTALAIDGDATNNTIAYALDDNAAGRFAIDPLTGVVTVADGSLLNAATPSHNIVVRATSSDSSTTTQLFSISVVNLVNNAPTLASHSITVASATTFTSSAGVFVSLSGDVDGDALTAAFVTAPSHGTFVLAANGSFVYTPAAGFVGTDSFVWRAFDGTTFSADATVTITVKPGAAITPPTPDPDPDPTPDPDPDPDPTPDPDPNPDPDPDPDPDDDGGGSGTSGPPGPGSAPPANDIDVLLPILMNDVEDGVAIFDVTGHRSLSLEGLDELSESEKHRVMLEQLRQTSRRGDDTTLDQMDVILMMAPGAMWTQMDATRDELESQIQGDLIVVGAAGAAASGFTVGFVAWAIRSGFLVSGLLAQLPAWRSIDPLLIMQGFGDSEDEETLEELMQRESESLD